MGIDVLKQHGIGQSSGLWKSQAASLQFVILAILFAVPLFSDRELYLVQVEGLSWILVLEFAAIVMGGFIVGLFFVPLGASGSLRGRWFCTGLALLIATPLSIGFWREYGAFAALIFLWLVFATYCGAILVRKSRAERGRLLAEVGLRWLSYMLLFAVLASVLGTPVNVESWADTRAGLWFGLLYFATAGLLEGCHTFPRLVNRLFQLLNGRYRKLPVSVARYRDDQIIGFVATRNNIQKWALMLLTGVFCTGLSAPFLYFTLTWESWLGISLAWIFLLPFLMLGLLCLCVAPIHFLMAMKAGSILLNVNEVMLLREGKLQAEGVIPAYSSREQRQGISARLVLYELRRNPDPSLPLSVFETEKVLDKVELTHHQSSIGSSFGVDCTLPPSMQTDNHRAHQSTGVRYVLQLRIAVDELIVSSPVNKTPYSWECGFVLPFRQRA